MTNTAAPVVQNDQVSINETEDQTQLETEAGRLSLDEKSVVSRLSNLDLDPKREPLLPQEDEDDDLDRDSQAGKLTTKENRDTGTIGVKYYFYYMKRAGCFLSLLCIFFFAVAITFTIGADWWVGQWSEQVYNLTDEEYQQAYAMIGVCCFVFLVLRAVTLGYVTEIASVQIFRKILWNILRRPMSFFDTTPSGVIINRCINDVD
jgi:hypothetical protein